MFDHCTSFEQLANEGPIELPELRQLSRGDLDLAKRISELRALTYSNKTAQILGLIPVNGAFATS